MGGPIVVYDTSLRDGMQGEGINYSLEDKVQIALKWTSSRSTTSRAASPSPTARRRSSSRGCAGKKLRHARIVAFGSTRRPHGKAESDPQILALLHAETPAVIVVGKSWKAHVAEVLRTTPEENLRMIGTPSPASSATAGRRSWTSSTSLTAGRTTPIFALGVLRAGREAGADCMILCDTNGGDAPRGGGIHP